MKKILILSITVLLFSGLSGSEKEKIEKEKETIKMVISEATNAYRARDYNRIAAMYIQDETVIKTGAAKAGFRMTSGWEEVGSNYKQNFTNNPEPITRKLEKVNYKIKVYKQSAWSVHDEIQYLQNGQKNKQIITHFLEKEDNKWKIVYMSIIGATSYDVKE